VRRRNEPARTGRAWPGFQRAGHSRDQTSTNGGRPLRLQGEVVPASEKEPNRLERCRQFKCAGDRWPECTELSAILPGKRGLFSEQGGAFGARHPRNANAKPVLTMARAEGARKAPRPRTSESQSPQKELQAQGEGQWRRWRPAGAAKKVGGPSCSEERVKADQHRARGGRQSSLSRGECRCARLVKRLR